MQRNRVKDDRPSGVLFAWSYAPLLVGGRHVITDTLPSLKDRVCVGSVLGIKVGHHSDDFAQKLDVGEVLHEFQFGAVISWVGEHLHHGILV